MQHINLYDYTSFHKEDIEAKLLGTLSFKIKHCQKI